MSWAINGEVKSGEQAKIYSIFQRLYHLRDVIEEAYHENEQLTSAVIKWLLVTKWPDVSVSISIIKHTYKEIEWICSLGR